MTQQPFLPYDRLKQVGFREIPVDADKIFIINGSVGSVWTEQEFSATPIVWLIQNTHASQDLRISFDGGSTYFTLFSKSGIVIGAKNTAVYVYGTGAATTYDIIGFEQ